MFVIMKWHSDTQWLVCNLLPGVAGVAAQLQQSLNAGESHLSSSQQSILTRNVCWIRFNIMPHFHFACVAICPLSQSWQRLNTIPTFLSSLITLPYYITHVSLSAKQCVCVVYLLGVWDYTIGHALSFCASWLNYNSSFHAIGPPCSGTWMLARSNQRLRVSYSNQFLSQALVDQLFV